MINIDAESKLHIELGHLIGTRVAVLGSSGSGKSNCVAVLVEEIVNAIPGVIFDIHDEYWGLCEKFPFLRVGVNAPAVEDATVRRRSPPVALEVRPGQAAVLAEKVFHQRIPVIVNMLYMDEHERTSFVLNYCEALWEINKAYNRPYWVVLEEAHNFIPQRSKTEALDQLRQFAAEGRKFGFTVIMASQRTSKINKDLLAECDYMFLHRINIQHDEAAYRGLLPKFMNAGVKDFRTLHVGQAIVKWQQAGSAQFDLTHIRRRHTLHVATTPGSAAVVELPPLKALSSAVMDDLLRQLSPKPRKAEAKTDAPAPEPAAPPAPAAPSPDPDLLARVSAQTWVIALLLSQPLKPLPAPSIPDAAPLPDVTDAGIRKQQRMFEAMLRDIVKGNQYRWHITLLKYLIEREDLMMTTKDISRFIGLSAHTVADHPPLYLTRAPITLIQRYRFPDGFMYGTCARNTLAERFPDLNTDDLIQRILDIDS